MSTKLISITSGIVRVTVDDGWATVWLGEQVCERVPLRDLMSALSMLAAAYVADKTIEDMLRKGR